MNAPAMTQLAAIKQGARATWAAGDYPAIARMQLWEMGPRVVAAAAIRPGEDVLDVACGTGNVAIRAAQAGATVTGLDLTPELFDAGRALAADAQVTVDWVQGDAEDLPFPDASFDVVASSFGCMFAPRHQVTADELARVLRPDGRLVVTGWAPDGAMGTFFRTVGRYLPPPPPIAEPPILWGDEDHVRGLFAASGVDVRFERGTLAGERFPTTEEALEFFETRFGPMMMAKQLTQAAGTWDALRADIVEAYERDEPMAYLMAIGVRS
jgi:SAM-dependent methyltransferase